MTAQIEIVKDAVTLGGACTDEDEPYTMKRLRRLQNGAEDIRDDLEEL